MSNYEEGRLQGRISGLNEAVAIGNRREAEGWDDGYARGHTDGWNKALREEAYPAAEDRDDLRWALNALAVIATSALQALESAPESVRRSAVIEYNNLTMNLIESGVLRCDPHGDPALLRLQPYSANAMPKICDALNEADRRRRSSADNDPSP